MVKRKSALIRVQESQIMASVTGDPAMLDFYRNGGGDMHSLVAKMSYPNKIPSNTRIEDIHKLYPDLRQSAKKVEFAINYGGDGNTIAQNDPTITKYEGKQIYTNYMKGFPGVKAYQDYCRANVVQKGYILLNPVTKHKVFCKDWELFNEISNEMQNDPSYWAVYNQAKKDKEWDSDIIREVRFYNRTKSEMCKHAIDYKIQGRGSMCFKLASIYFFNWIMRNNLFNVVKLCIPVHDETNAECPTEIADKVSVVLRKCMEKGAEPFCTKLHLSADIAINEDGTFPKHWVH